MEKKFTLDDLSNEEYHSGSPWNEYVSSTDLKHYLVSPRYYKWQKEHPQPQTDAQRFGSLFHSLMECLARAKGDWHEGYADWKSRLAMFEPPKNPKTDQPYGAATKTYLEAYERFLADNQGKEVIDAPTFGRVGDMAHALFSECGQTSVMVRKLLGWGKAELSHFVDYKGYGFKFRPDLETAKKIIDYKTVNTDDLSERSINNIIARYGYDISAAFYLFLEHEMSGKWKTFYWLFITKNPPYDAILVDASEWTYKFDPVADMVLPQVGAIKMKRLVDLHIKCMKENQWPGSEINLPEDENGNRIMLPTPPPWEVNAASDILLDNQDI